MSFLRNLLSALRGTDPMATATANDVKLQLAMIRNHTSEARGRLADAEAADWGQEEFAALLIELESAEVMAASAARVARVVRRRHKRMASQLEQIRSMRDLRGLPEAGEDR